jgi:hypothetical protein
MPERFCFAAFLPFFSHVVTLCMFPFVFFCARNKINEGKQEKHKWSVTKQKSTFSKFVEGS